MNWETLDRELLDAHAKEDRDALIRLYTEAGNQSETAGNTDAAWFYLTHAFVFALEAGSPDAPHLNARLAEQGRAIMLSYQ
ncbi:hypothetical protein [Pseudovibrio sp. POLY-S9]|uniref:hypothetical protein n=1 Tax=Pseudovibrio sp. POLY-S9 TaxID=1576596 RepID=UPI00070A91B7|nr:hypothetical protein [Pseudovibrio sp. POLY-S9]